MAKEIASFDTVFVDGYGDDGEFLLDLQRLIARETGTAIGDNLLEATAFTLVATGQDGDIANLENIVNGIQTMTVYKNVSDEAGVSFIVAQKLLAGETPGEELLAELGVEAAFDTESYNNNVGIVPSYLLVPWTVTKDNLNDLVDTGLYAWNGDYLVAAN